MNRSAHTHHRRNAIRPILTTGILALLSASALAATWTGAGNGVSWSDGNNWLGGVAPVSATPGLAVNMAPSSVTNLNLGPFTLHILDYGLTYSPGTQLSGATITFADLGTGLPAVFQARTTTVNNNLVLATDTNFDGYQGTTLNGSVSGTGNLTTKGDHIFNGPVSTSGILNIGNPIFGGGGTFNGPITNASSVNVNAGTVTFAGPITGAMPLVVGTNAGAILTGVNNYTGGSTVNGGNAQGTTVGIQGNWVLNGGGSLQFSQNFAGTSAATVSGTGSVGIINSGTNIDLTGNMNASGVLSLYAVAAGAKTVLSGNNVFGSGVSVGSFSIPTWLGFGSNTAAGTGTITLTGGSNASYAFSAEGGPRTVANSLVFDVQPSATLEFKGTNHLTFTDLTAHALSGTVTHTSTATTTLGGAFLGQNTSVINVNAGQLVLGRAVNNGFRMDGAINVASGATLQMISNSPVKLGPTNLNGGTLIAPSGVAVPTGLALTAAGTIQGRVSSEAGSLIEATGPLAIGDATSFGGFFSNGELREKAQGVTLFDKNQAVLGSLTEVGTGANPGLLTAANGVFVDFGRAITGYGIVAGTNALPQATIINGAAAGTSNVQPLDFTGYVKGVGTFTDVNFSGTFSPGLSPAIVPVNNVSFGAGGTLLIEIGGLTPGSQYDQLNIGGVLGLGGLLDVDLINGFNPANGDVFNILAGTTSSTFSNFSFPTLNAGLAWDTSDLYTLGNLKVAPEPSSAALVLLALAGAALRRRRR